MRKLAVAITALLLIAVLAMVVGVVVMDGERLGRIAAERVESGGELKMTIRSIRRSVSFAPRIVAQGIEVRAPRFGDRPLLAIERAAFGVKLTSLLFGPIELDDVVVEDTRLVVLFDDEGSLYWGHSVAQILRRIAELDWSVQDFSVRKLRAAARHPGRHVEAVVSIGALQGSAPRPADLRFMIEDLETDFRAPGPMPSGRLHLDELSLQRVDDQHPVRVTGRGSVSDVPLRIDIRGDNPLADPAHARRELRAHVELGESVFDLDGTLSRGRAPHVDVRFGADFAAIDSGSSSASNIRLAVRDENDAWKIRDFAMRFGDASVSGSLTLEQRQARPMLRGFLQTSGLEVSVPGPKPSASSPSRAEEPKDGTRLFTIDEAFSGILAAIGRFDARLELEAGDLVVLGAPVEKASAPIELSTGRMIVGPVEARALGGVARARLIVDAHTSPPLFEIEASCEAIETSEIAANLDIEGDVFGTIEGRLDLDARGSDPQEIAGSTKGRMTLFMTDGRLAAALAQLADMDLASALVGSFGGDETTPIHCGVADFEGSDGVLAARTLIFDTGSVKLVGSGEIDVEKRALDLLLDPRAKDFSVLSASSPIRIRGPLTEPRVSTNVARAAATLLSPIELGLAESTACRSLIDQVSERSPSQGAADR